MTLLQMYITLVTTLAPHHEDLAALGDECTSANQIVDYVFSAHGEYLGGMASAYVSVAEATLAQQAKG